MEESGIEVVRSELKEEDELPLMKRVWKECLAIWVVAAPALFTRISTYGINISSQVFIGHIGSKELAAFAIAFTVIMKFANGIMYGMASALSTLCGQAYGAKRYGMLGVYLQRSWIVLFSTAFLLLPLFIFTAPIMKMLRQDEGIADVAGIICLWAIPVLFAFVLSFTFQTFLQSQSRNFVISFLAAFSIAIHVLLSWLLTIKYKYGVPGAMISTIVAFWVPNIGQYIFVTCGGCPKTWKGFSVLAFKDLWPVVKLSLSSGVMLCLEVWYGAVLVLLAGSVKDAEVQIDALAICVNINGWEMMIGLGFLAAASVRVSNELGRGSAKAAKFSIVVTVATSFTIGFILFLFFLFLRERLAYVFTTNEQVVAAVGDLSPYLAFSILLNSVQPVLSGVAVGAGWQKIVAYVNIGCYYLIGIPVGVILSKILHMQVKGIWLGMLFGTLVQTIVLIIITCKTDWDEQVELARRRVDRYSVDDQEETGAA
ncbi:hypothetical protein K1719_027166 [Acacia pycnantha]|nr:hypothetical protein K1719_027166 [Acacia pycnantha]